MLESKVSRWCRVLEAECEVCADRVDIFFFVISDGASAKSALGRLLAMDVDSVQAIEELEVGRR